jgi:hypothetical protein
LNSILSKLKQILPLNEWPTEDQIKIYNKSTENQNEQKQISSEQSSTTTPSAPAVSDDSSDIDLFYLSSRSTMKSMLIYENELRLSSYWQGRFSAVENDLFRDWIDEIDELQKVVVQKFLPSSLCENETAIKFAINILRSCQTLFPGDRELVDIALYIKYNRARRGKMKVGDQVENVDLYEYTTKLSTSLFSILSCSIPVCLISGSWS